MPIEEAEDDESSDLVSTVEELILQGFAGSNASVGGADSVLTEPAESISLSDDGSVSESQASIELREMLQAVRLLLSW
jgi:hypothetical protein